MGSRFKLALAGCFALLLGLFGLFGCMRAGAPPQSVGPVAGPAGPAAVVREAPGPSLAQEQVTPAPTETPVPPAPSPTPTPGVSEAAKAEAVDLLGAAVSERQRGRLVAALDLARQALGKWPEYTDAERFLAEVVPQATAQAQATAVQATAQAQAAATAQAQAQATAQARATAQAAAQAAQATAQAAVMPGLRPPAPIPPAPRTAALAYGFQGHFFDSGRRPQAIGWIKNAGFGWAKQQARWEDYEIRQPECAANPANCLEQTINGRQKYFKKDQVSWLDALVDDINGSGLSLLLSVVRAPAFYAAAGGHSPADPDTLRDFMQFLTGRYAGKVKAVEPWNEQNLSWEWGGARLWPNAPAAPPQGVVEFVRLQKAAYEGSKAGDSRVIVVLPALTPTGLGECWLDAQARTQGGCLNQVRTAIDDRLYLDFLFQVNNGEIKRYYDVLGVHPSGYNNPPDDFVDQKTVPTTTFKGHGSFYIKRYQQLREVQLKHGDTKPMWFTEVGWASARLAAQGYEYARDNTEAARGKYIARLLEQVHAEAPYVTNVFLWNLNFRSVVPEADEKYAFGLINADGSATPGYTCATDFVKSGNQITRAECRP